LQGKEDNNTSNLSLIKIVGKDELGKLITNGTTLIEHELETSLHDNKQSFNYTLFPLWGYNYPLMLSDMIITLTCPGKSAHIRDFSIIFVYN
jgi:hypothetical protein